MLNQTARGWRFCKSSAMLMLLGLVLVACGSPGDSQGDLSATAPATTGDNADGAQSGSPIIIPSNFALSGGPFQDYGVPSTRGLELGIEQVNDDGGVTLDGETRLLELKSEDNRSEPSRAVGITESFGEDEGYNVMFGPLVSVLTLPTAEVTADLDMIHFSPAAGFADIAGTEEYPHLFMTQLHEVDRAKAEVGFYLNNFEIQTVSGLNRNDAAGQAYWEAISDEFEANGVEIVSEEYFEPETSDFSSHLTRVREAQPDALYFGWGDDVGQAITRQALELQVSDLLLARAVTVDVFSQANVPSNVTVAGSSAVPNLGEPTSQEVEGFVDRYREEYGEPEPTAYWALTFYDYVQMWAKAVEEVGSLDDVDAIAQALGDMTHEGALTVQFSDRNIAVHDFDAFTIQDGETTWERIAPPQLE